MASACCLRFLSLDSQRISSSGVELRTDLSLNGCRLNVSRAGNRSFQHQLIVTACSNAAGDILNNNNDDESINNLKKRTHKFEESIGALPPIVLTVERQSAANFLLTFCIATTCLIIAVRIYVVKRSKYNRHGTVADLVRRGQLRSDRRGISKPLKYEDPFNNPLMKVGKGNSTVEMCGKVYRLAPVTLTEEQQAIHQKRRSRAYQWKRPKVFLKEGDSIPPDVDPDTIRWIPANHPFATTVSDIDEDLAQNNVYQKHGVPFRIQAEHEALQRKLESLQNEQKLSELVIDPANAKDFERAFKAQLRSHEQLNQSLQKGQVSDSKPPKSDEAPESFDSSPPSR